ncbi:hypothetical protein DFH09DRAFT_1173345 [Mycena vulgaris]|nr:hypothetical protein DFH09DRAFT_1173345 [Mycena vulgaris]
MQPLAVFVILARRISGGLARHVSGVLARHVSVVLARCVSIMRIDECRHAPRSTPRPRGVGGVTDELVRPDSGACALASRAENRPEDEMRTNMRTSARCSPRERVSSDGVDVLLSPGLGGAGTLQGT